MGLTQKKNNYYLFFELLATPLRMDIISLLKERGSLCVGEICEAVGEEQSKVSHNLRRLAECNVVWVKKEGNYRHYSLNGETILPMLQLIDKHAQSCCKVCKHLGAKKCTH
jgi:ArsR family transcriptional regulator